jgi:hypothetical protein
MQVSGILRRSIILKIFRFPFCFCVVKNHMQYNARHLVAQSRISVGGLLEFIAAPEIVDR